MLTHSDGIATVAVKDLAAARKYYGDTLGLKLVRTQGEEALDFLSGHSHLTVYRSQYAGTNKATVVGWNVKDIEAEVAELRARHVKFEHYDVPGLKRHGDIYAADGFKAAWFKDPEGNILSLVSTGAA
jgi:catechol 2,3-dioxygenase-like lactoylglutathione lyase family enzyme